jgi:hypothetical protein
MAQFAKRGRARKCPGTGFTGSIGEPSQRPLRSISCPEAAGLQSAQELPSLSTILKRVLWTRIAPCDLTRMMVASWGQLHHKRGCVVGAVATNRHAVGVAVPADGEGDEGAGETVEAGAGCFSSAGAGELTKTG